MALLGQAARARPTQPSAAPVPLALKVSAPTSALTDDPISFTVTRLAGPTPRAAMVHWRQQGSPTFRTPHMAADATGHFRARLPVGAALEPALEYYAEAVDAEGATHAPSGTATQPQRLGVHMPPSARAAEQGGRGRVRIHDEYVDFNREVELGLGSHVGLGGKLLLGGNSSGFALGLGGKLRLGRPRGARAEVEGEYTQDLGAAATARLAWDSEPPKAPGR